MTKTEIANLALSWLGCNPIPDANDVNDTSPEAIMIRANYLPSRDATLESHAWTFAKTSQPLSLSPITPPVAQYTYQYIIPTNVIRILRAILNTGYDLEYPWERMGGFIFASEQNVCADMIVRVDDTTSFSPLFIKAFAARMAADMAIPLTENRNLANDMEAKYQGFVREAAYTDGSQGSMQQLKPTRLPGRLM